MSDDHDEHQGDKHAQTAAEDQVNAAIADARQRFDAGGPSQTSPPGTSPAIGQLQEMLASCGRSVSRQCKHVPASGFAPVNWMPADSGTWYCDACAARVLERRRRDGYSRCDLCGRSLASEPHPVLVQTRVMYVTIHAVTCRACAPGPQFTPRTNWDVPDDGEDDQDQDEA